MDKSAVVAGQSIVFMPFNEPIDSYTETIQRQYREGTGGIQSDMHNMRLLCACRASMFVISATRKIIQMLHTFFFLPPSIYVYIFFLHFHIEVQQISCHKRAWDAKIQCKSENRQRERRERN